MSILAPVVPNVPGVPPLSFGASVAIPQQMTGDTTAALVEAGATQWGIYLDGVAVIVPDSVVSLEYKKDWHISDYPIEQGSFESYNKVRMPYEARIALTKGGSEADRNAFLAQLEALAASLDLYDLVTPEVTYVNANITHLDTRRTSTNGVSLLTVYVWFQEIRMQASSAFTQTAQPAGAQQVSGGTVQPQPASPAQQKTVTTGAATGSW